MPVGYAGREQRLTGVARNNLAQLWVVFYKKYKTTA